MLNVCSQREEENIATFIKLTGTTKDVAREFLEVSTWDVEVCLLILFYFAFYSLILLKINKKINSREHEKYIIKVQK